MKLLNGITGNRIKRVECPLHFPRSCVEREKLEPGRCAIEHAVDDDGVALDLRMRGRVGIAGVIFPGDLQGLNVSQIDLRKRRVFISRRIAANIFPAAIRCIILLEQENSSITARVKIREGILVSGYGWRLLV